jgi:glycosyltransferase involved in cell wall biosynthesis
MECALISCVVPVFNGERYLAETLKSIFAQSWRPLEVIVVDDGSTDGTPEIVASHGASVRYLKQSNSGAAAARNLGVRAASGEFIAFLDADDLWHSEKLARQIDVFQQRPELGLCLTHLQNFWITELAPEKNRFEGHRLADVLPGYVTQTLLARRSLFEHVGEFNVDFRLGDATDWFLRTAEAGAIMELLPDVLVYRRMHETNISMEPGSRRMTATMQNAQLAAVKASLDRRRSRNSGVASLKFPTSKAS